MKFRQLAAALGLLLLQGAASAQEGKFAAPFIAAKPPSADEALVYVYRLYTAPMAWSSTLSLNSVKVAELPTRTYSYLYVKPGEYVLKMNFPFLAGMPSADGKISFGAGQTYFIRAGSDISLSSGTTGPKAGVGGMTFKLATGITRMDPDEALPEIQPLTFTKPALERVD